MWTVEDGSNAAEFHPNPGSPASRQSCPNREQHRLHLIPTERGGRRRCEDPGQRVNVLRAHAAIVGAAFGGLSSTSAWITISCDGINARPAASAVVDRQGGADTPIRDSVAGSLAAAPEEVHHRADVPELDSRDDRAARAFGRAAASLRTTGRSARPQLASPSPETAS
jgi:hypothetical protein